MIGASCGLRAALERVGLVAATDSTVLITGETGTGKELVARAIAQRVAALEPRAGHGELRRLAEGLVASEPFGYEKGAFTGAFERRRGRWSWRRGARSS